MPVPPEWNRRLHPSGSVCLLRLAIQRSATRPACQHHASQIRLHQQSFAKLLHQNHATRRRCHRSRHPPRLKRTPSQPSSANSAPVVCTEAQLRSHQLLTRFERVVVLNETSRRCPASSICSSEKEKSIDVSQVSGLVPTPVPNAPAAIRSLSVMSSREPTYPNNSAIASQPTSGPGRPSLLIRLESNAGSA